MESERINISHLLILLRQIANRLATLHTYLVQYLCVYECIHKHTHILKCVKIANEQIFKPLTTLRIIVFIDVHVCMYIFTSAADDLTLQMYG